MIIYISPATDYSIYDKGIADGTLFAGQQAQKFNNLLIRGIAAHTPVTALSALSYNALKKTHTKRRELSHEGVRYICVENRPGKLSHKISNVISLIREIKKCAKSERPQALVCDSVHLASSAATLYCSRRLGIPGVAIVTDVPEIMCENGMGIWMKMCAQLMKKHDSYVLLTKAMNDIVNPRGKPYIVMEGSCENPDETESMITEKEKPPVCLFSGSLGKNGGTECMVQGFLKSCSDIAQLRFFGNGDYVPELKSICTSNPSVKYMGVVTNREVVEEQKKASLLINPRFSTLTNTKYSFPSKLTEYMASGTPVLTTRLPGIPKDYDDYLYFIDDETEDGFARSIKEILDKPESERTEFGRRAQEFILRDKSKEAQGKRILTLCEALMKQKNRRR